MPDIIITPSSGIIDFFPVSTRVGRIEGSGNTINIVNPSGFVAVSGSGLSINTSSPNATFHAYSATSGATLLNIEGTNGSLFSVIDNLSGTLMSVNNNAGLPVFEVFSDDRVVAGRFGQNDFIMTSGGNVGIGTGVPSSKFHVVGTSTFNGDVSSTGSFIAGSGSAALPSFEFINDVDTGLFSPATNAFGISTSGVERLRIDNIGRVGIGTSSPSSTLQVSGLITANSGNFTQSLQVNGTGVSISGHTHTSSNITDFNSSVSGLLPTIANSGDNRVLTSTGSSVGINAESNLTFDGQNLSAPYLLSTYASGDEGGEIQLAKPPSGTLSGGITIDAYQNRLRFFEQGGSARGFYLDLSSGGAGVSTNLAGGGSATTVSNYGDNRIITSDGTTTGLNAESNFTFNGSLLSVTGSGSFSGDVRTSGSFIGGSGTAALPSFEFVNDPDTGMFSPATNTIGLATSGVERLRVNSAGNIGIGTTSPTSQLHVSGTCNLQNLVLTNGTNSVIKEPIFSYTTNEYASFYSTYMGLTYSRSSGGFTTYYASDDSFIQWSAEDNFWILYDSSYSYILLDYFYNVAEARTNIQYLEYNGLSSLNINGNVGIGTSTPSEKLDVYGSIRSADSMGNLVLGYNVNFDQYGLTNLSSSLPLWIVSDTTDMKLYSSIGITIDADVGNTLLQPNGGSVGIGTITPSLYKLDINGTVGDSTNGFISVQDLTISNTTAGTIGVDAGINDLSIGGDGTITIASAVDQQVNINSNVNITGNVGIGTSTPTHNLHVVGSGLITNGLSVSSTIINSGVALLPIGSLNSGSGISISSSSGNYTISATSGGGGGSTNASDLISGTLSDDRLSAKVMAAVNIYLVNNFS